MKKWSKWDLYNNLKSQNLKQPDREIEQGIRMMPVDDLKEGIIEYLLMKKRTLSK